MSLCSYITSLLLSSSSFFYVNWEETISSLGNCNKFIFFLVSEDKKFASVYHGENMKSFRGKTLKQMKTVWSRFLSLKSWKLETLKKLKKEERVWSLYTDWTLDINRTKDGSQSKSFDEDEVNNAMPSYYKNCHFLLSIVFSFICFSLVLFVKYVQYYSLFKTLQSQINKYCLLRKP